MFSWDLVKAYLALVRTGSYERGAQTLGIDQTTMRRRIQQLENELGMTLFVRRGNILQGNSAGSFVLDAALEMERAAIRFQHITQSDVNRGSVRVTTLDILADILAPGFVRFRQANPQVLLNITTEPHFVDLDRDMVDIALRLARPRTGENGLKKVATVRFGLYGARAYLQRHAAQPQGTLHDIVSLCALYAHGDHDFELADEQWHRQREALGEAVIRADSYTTMTTLCEQGAGLAMLPCFLAETSENLLRFEPARVDLAVDLWIVIRKDMGGSPKVRLLVDFLTEELRKLRPILKGAESASARTTLAAACA